MSLTNCTTLRRCLTPAGCPTDALYIGHPLLSDQAKFLDPGSSEQ